MDKTRRKDLAAALVHSLRDLKTGTEEVEAVDCWLEGFEKEIREEAANDPIPLLLWCPCCNTRHIDEGENALRPHRTHACQNCGALWAVSVVPTVGVRFLPGCKNEVPGG